MSSLPVGTFVRREKKLNKLGLSCAKPSIYMLLLVKFWFLHQNLFNSSVTSLNLNFLVQTGTITADIFKISGEVAIVNMTNVVPGQMLHGKMLH